jgi:hypothetical protein
LEKLEEALPETREDRIKLEEILAKEAEDAISSEDEYMEE